MRRSAGAVYLLYDADCGPCTEFKRLVKDLDLRHKINPVPLQRDFAYELVRTEMTHEEMMRSMHVVYHDAHSVEREDEHKIFSGGDALMELIRFFPLGFLFYSPLRNQRALRRFSWDTYTFMTRLRRKSKSCPVFEKV
jgi:predicted DCC family thiol-disulfide oxidoreductase YuxK